MRARLAVVFSVMVVSTACKPASQAITPERRADRGEPCFTLNDCKEPLLCLSGVCLDATPTLSATNKQCVVAQCTEDSDCCPSLTQLQRNECAETMLECQRAPTSSACRDHQRDCTCTRSCQHHACVETEPQGQFCVRDSDCYQGTCQDGACRQCTDDAECGSGFVCELGRCNAGCLRDEECGRLETCVEARCEARGCVSHRECVAILDRRDAVCQNEECGVPCKSDAGCAGLGAFSSCQDGLCRDLGCEQNSDCEARFRAPDRELILCLEADEARMARQQRSIQQAYE